MIINKANKLRLGFRTIKMIICPKQVDNQNVLN